MDNEKKQEALDRRYIRMAAIWAENSYCQRRQVGALIVKDKMIISDGYNGTPSGFFEQKAWARAQLLPSVEETCMSTQFSHIFSGGYAAGYYSYKWAEVLDADAFSLFQEKGVISREVAESFRRNILEKGGTEHPMQLYLRFRGRKPSIDALLKRNGIQPLSAK